jgi:hypothetical protein
MYETHAYAMGKMQIFLKVNVLEQWFPNGAPQIPRGLRPVPRGSMDTFL